MGNWGHGVRSGKTKRNRGGAAELQGLGSVEHVGTVLGPERRPGGHANHQLPARVDCRPCIRLSLRSFTPSLLTPLNASLIGALVQSGPEVQRPGLHFQSQPTQFRK